jgi:hypothetical protein
VRPPPRRTLAWGSENPHLAGGPNRPRAGAPGAPIEHPHRARPALAAPLNRRRVAVGTASHPTAPGQRARRRGLSCCCSDAKDDSSALPSPAPDGHQACGEPGEHAAPRRAAAEGGRRPAQRRGGSLAARRRRSRPPGRPQGAAGQEHLRIARSSGGGTAGSRRGRGAHRAAHQRRVGAAASHQAQRERRGRGRCAWPAWPPRRLVAAAGLAGPACPLLCGAISAPAQAPAQR